MAPPRRDGLACHGWGDDNLSWLQPSGIFPLDLPREALDDIDLSAWTEGESPNGLDTIFFSVGVNNVFNSSATTFFIDCSLSLYFNCSIDEAADEVKVRYGDLYEPRGTVSFQVDEDGLDPAVSLPGDKWVADLATIRIKSSLESDIPISDDPPCPILDEDEAYALSTKAPRRPVVFGQEPNAGNGKLHGGLVARRDARRALQRRYARCARGR